MKSKNNEKENTTESFKLKLLKLFISEEYLKEFEEKEKTNPKEAEKEKDSTTLYICIFVIILVLSIVFVIYEVNANNKNTKNETTTSISQEENNTSQIKTRKLDTYFIDKQNNKYVDMYYTTLGDKVTYSITYNDYSQITGTLEYTQYFKNGYVTYLLLNGYPYVSYEDMELQSEDEAYLATQLAVYEISARKGYSDGGNFSLDEITSSKSEYNDLANRVIEKAKSLVNIAISNPYVNENSASVDKSKIEYKDEGDDTIVGPIYVNSIEDDSTKRYFGGKGTYYTDIYDMFTDLVEDKDSNAYIVDEDGNKALQVKNGEPFYVKIEGSHDFFVQFRISANMPKLYTKIYENSSRNKEYVIVDTKTLYVETVMGVNQNIEVGNVHIKFTNSNDEIIPGVKYYLCDENGEIIQDIDGFGDDETYTLPIGKYIIKEYEPADGYIINLNEYPFSIDKSGENVDINVKNDKISELM